MTTSFSRLHSLRCVICWSAAACLLGLQSRASAGPSDVTAVVNDDGTLEIKRALGTSGNEGAFFVGIRLEGDLDQDISIFVDDVLLDTFSRTAVSAIDVDADQSLVTFGQFSLFEFEGEIAVDVRTGGRCELLTLALAGDLTLSGSSGRIVVEYRSAIVDGDVTLVGGPRDDAIFPWLFLSGSLSVCGNLRIEGGPGSEFIQLQDAVVSQDTLIDLGQSSGGNDSDLCDIPSGLFCGSVVISGDEGDDALFLGEFFGGPIIGGDLLVDLGNGADSVSIFGLTLLPCSDDQPTPILFLDGGNGNSDELSVAGFEIFDDEYTGFETVTIP